MFTQGDRSLSIRIRRGPTDFNTRHLDEPAMALPTFNSCRQWLRRHVSDAMQDGFHARFKRPLRDRWTRWQRTRCDVTRQTIHRLACRGGRYRIEASVERDLFSACQWLCAIVGDAIKFEIRKLDRQTVRCWLRTSHGRFPMAPTPPKTVAAARVRQRIRDPRPWTQSHLDGTNRRRHEAVSPRR